MNFLPAGVKWTKVITEMRLECRVILRPVQRSSFDKRVARWDVILDRGHRAFVYKTGAYFRVHAVVTQGPFPTRNFSRLVDALEHAVGTLVRNDAAERLGAP